MSSLLKKYVNLFSGASSWGDEETGVNPVVNTVKPTQSITEQFGDLKLSREVNVLPPELYIPLPTNVPPPPPLIRQDGLYPHSLPDYVTITDSVDGLNCYHYTSCDDNSSPDVKEYRGIVKRGDKVVCKTFGYITEVSSAERERVKSMLSGFNQSRVFSAQEGATLRVYWDGEKWRLSTHRKIDAFTSKWGKITGKSFGEMFMDALLTENVDGKYRPEDLFSSFCETLDKTRVYAFLVRNTRDSRIVCVEPVRPKMYFIGMFDQKTGFLLQGNDSGIEYPPTLEFATPDTMLDYVDNVDVAQTSGVVVYMPNGTQLKVTSPHYLQFFNVRGNEPSVKFRYLQIRGDKSMVGMLYNLYPESIPTFELYESTIETVKTRIHRAYVDRYVNREYVRVPKPEFSIMESAHNWHLSNKKSNIVTRDYISFVVDGLHPSALNRLIKPYVLGKGK
jgi:hypothetical protein